MSSAAVPSIAMQLLHGVCGVNGRKFTEVDRLHTGGVLLLKTWQLRI